MFQSTAGRGKKLFARYPSFISHSCNTLRTFELSKSLSGDTSDHTCACWHTLRANFFAQALSVKLVSFTKDLHYHSNIILNFFHL